VRGVVDDEFDGLVAELVVEHLRERVLVGLVDAVVRTHDVAEVASLDKRGERGDGCRGELTRDKLAGLRHERDEGGATTGGDAELDDRLTVVGVAELGELVDEVGRLAKREALERRLVAVAVDKLDTVDLPAIFGELHKLRHMASLPTGPGTGQRAGPGTRENRRAFDRA
jgi:hypothetical protein